MIYKCPASCVFFSVSPFYLVISLFVFRLGQIAFLKNQIRGLNETTSEAQELSIELQVLKTDFDRIDKKKNILFQAIKSLNFALGKIDEYNIELKMEADKLNTELLKSLNINNNKGQK